MTDSVCWVDARDDVALSDDLRAQIPDKDPRPGREVELGSSGWNDPFWINRLEDWATRQALPIEYPDFGWIVKQVSVNRSQLLQFFQDHGWGDGHTTQIIRAHFQVHPDQGYIYRIRADEY